MERSLKSRHVTGWIPDAPRGAESTDGEPPGTSLSVIERPVLYVHIPKTAGTSVRTLLKRVCVGRSIVEMPLRREGRTAAARGFGARDVVVGHVGYGLKERFPGNPFVFTFLREPIARSLSNFSFLQQRSIDPAVAEDAADFVAAKGMSLGDFLCEEPAAASRHLGNLAVWFLTRDGIEPREDLRGLDRSDLESAKRNLEQLDLIGLVERMTESVLSLLWVLGCSPTSMRPLPFENTLQSRLTIDDLDEATLRLLIDRCSLDLELYDFASQLFRSRLAQQLPLIAAWLSEESDDPLLSGSGFAGVLELVREELDTRPGYAGRAQREGAPTLLQRVEAAEARYQKVNERMLAMERSKPWRLAQYFRGLAGRRW